MPPSPALRCSPVRELRAENHKRGHSLESGLHLREKDDDLALFNDMQNKERDNFLLQSADDFHDSFSTKLRYFSDFKLGISIPVRGESSELLNADGDKNDYDWLLTPPDTPLFPSLDDETPPVNLTHRGRPRSQPISISRSSTMEKSYRTSRSSASPHRLSPSPRSGNSTFQSRGKPSSAPHSSPTPVLRPTTPSRRPSTPPNNSSTYAPRSSTPTPRRMSTGSSGTLKTNRGNSASPKIRAWQSNFPGFSSDAPPNLRTSLADRPASYVRGSSPASRNGRDSSSKFGRQSMSPTASRSASSSYSHDRDRFSSHSKGSVVSSGDDDIDSLQSVPVGISDRSASRKVGAFPNSKASAFSKKTTRTLISSSAPKRSFDSALRQMDHRKSPQNMFRPLLSSVPSTTFYVAKANSVHRPMISRNSSITTSSNVSSEQGASIAPETEGSDHEQHDVASECEKPPYHDAQDEVFVFDKVDEVNKYVGLEIRDGLPNIRCGDFDRGNKIEVELGASEDISNNSAATAIAETASESLYLGGDYHENMAYCSKCGCKILVIEPVERNDHLCPDCGEKDGCLTLATRETTIIVTQNKPVQCEMTFEENKPSDELETVMGVSALPEITNRSEIRFAQHQKNVEQGQICLLDNSLARSVVEEGRQDLVDQKLVGEPTVGSSQSDCDTEDPQLQQFNAYPSLKVDVSEGAGISVLLERSNISKGPVVQGRAFTATNIPYDNPSYARDNLSSMRISFGHGSASASSSVDLSSSRQTETRIQRQLTGRRSDMENYRHDLNTKSISTGSSFSGISSHAYQALILAKSTSEDKFDVSIRNMEYNAVEETPPVTQEQDRASKNIELDDTDTSFTRTAVLEEDKYEQTESFGTTDASVLELSSCSVSIQLADNSVAAFPNDEVCVLSENAEGFPKNERIILDIDVSAMNPGSSSIEEDVMLSSSVVEASIHGSLVRISGELQTGRESAPDLKSGAAVSPNSDSIMDESPEPSVPTSSEKDVSVSAPESNISYCIHGILETGGIVKDQSILNLCQDDTPTLSQNLAVPLKDFTSSISLRASLADEQVNSAAAGVRDVEVKGSYGTGGLSSVQGALYQRQLFLAGGEFQDPLLSAPVIPTIVPALPPISQVYVPRRPRSASRARVPAHVGSSLPLPPSTSTSADPSLPLSDSDLDLPIAVRKEKSTVTVEGQGRNKVRSLSLEEATDTILFCSSIVHNLAYQAASIGMEKENLIPLEGSRPMVTILGKSSADRKDSRGRMASKHTPKSKKVRQRMVETDMRTPSTMTETDVKTNESLTHDSRVPNKADSGRPPKLESKCNCTVM
ncbi:hypothetical protein HHK36_029473 [Tetracentron sinense]|uniref:Uncharacterized protein n=1 Tax=Tetracentron sinense TaxID=13715 RepID=A0A834YE28_TETSI|nr:hypothetical protein HHK36_029473 [Tetracentron sinense]